MKDKFLKLLHQDQHSEEDIGQIIQIRKKITTQDLTLKEIQILTKILLNHSIQGKMTQRSILVDQTQSEEGRSSHLKSQKRNKSAMFAKYLDLKNNKCKDVKYVSARSPAHLFYF